MGKNVLKKILGRDVCIKLSEYGDGGGIWHVFPQLCGLDSDVGSENLDRHCCVCVHVLWWMLTGKYDVHMDVGRRRSGVLHIQKKGGSTRDLLSKFKKYFHLKTSTFESN